MKIAKTHLCTIISVCSQCGRIGDFDDKTAARKDAISHVLETGHKVEITESDTRIEVLSK